MAEIDEYDEFEEYLWIDYGEPHFTDDMAMLVNPDPVFIDDSSLEDALDSDTDWEEYLSDEYYDQDKPDKVHRQKKKIESKKPAQFDSATFYGVSWSAGSPLNNDGPLYQPGEGEKVSLLKNWREVFQESKPKTKTSEKLKQDGSIRATFHDHLSTRFRRNSEQGALVNDNLNLGNNMETDGLSRPVSGLKTFLLGSSMWAEKKGRDHLFMNNNGPQLKKGSSARAEAKPNNNLDIILPPAPKNIEEYKEIITTAPPVTQKRGRKRKADVTVEQTTPDLDSNSASGLTRSSKRKKAGHTNGIKTATSSRPIRSSTRRK